MQLLNMQCSRLPTLTYIQALTTTFYLVNKSHIYWNHSDSVSGTYNTASGQRTVLHILCMYSIHIYIDVGGNNQDIVDSIFMVM